MAPYFIKNFEDLNPEENFVIAPEGLHRFYIKGTSGRVGASWMTKEDRLTDIKDYVTFLDNCKQHFEGQLQPRKTILLGFSQGVSTAGRWMGLGNIQPDVFVNWAGVFPPDLDDSDLLRTKSIPHIFCIGDDDPYWSGEDIDRYNEKLKSTFISYQNINFKGKHQITNEALDLLDKMV